jgi:hypothetical protein
MVLNSELSTEFSNEVSEFPLIAVRVRSKFGGAIPRKERAISRSNSKIRAATICSRSFNTRTLFC